MYTLSDPFKDVLLNLYESLFPSQYLSFRQARMFRLINGANQRVCQPDTDLCVEGFPRSANSFTFPADWRLAL